MIPLIGLFNIIEPKVKKAPYAVLSHGGFNTTAEGVSHNDDVFHFQVLDGVLEDTVHLGSAKSYAQICRKGTVGDVSMNKDLTRLSVGKLIGGSSRVRATNK